MKTAMLTISLLLLSVSAYAQGLTHDLRVDSIISPRGRMPVGAPQTIIARIENRGTSDEKNFAIEFSVRDAVGYRFGDTIGCDSIHSGEVKDVIESVQYTPVDTGMIEV